ncbi:MAG: hypothetical protein V4757_07380 [Pseudomonadota bacterium]
MNTITPEGWAYLGLIAFILLLALFLCVASKDADGLNSPHDPVKLQAERTAAPAMCDADSDYDWLTSERAPLADDEAERKAMVAAAPWQGYL